MAKKSRKQRKLETARIMRECKHLPMVAFAAEMDVQGDLSRALFRARFEICFPKLRCLLFPALEWQGATWAFKVYADVPEIILPGKCEDVGKYMQFALPWIRSSLHKCALFYGPQVRDVLALSPEGIEQYRLKQMRKLGLNPEDPEDCRIARSITIPFP